MLCKDILFRVNPNGESHLVYGSVLQQDLNQLMKQPLMSTHFPHFMLLVEFFFVTTT